MFRLPRPYIPIEVRCRVVLRQLGEAFPDELIAGWRQAVGGLGRLLRDKLDHLAVLLGCEVKDLRLDHNPALAARERFHSEWGALHYRPDANDPEYLIYREKHAHHIKTNVRGDGAQHPDRVLIKKERKRGRKRRPKVKIRSRGFRKVAKQRRPQLPLPPRRNP